MTNGARVRVRRIQRASEQMQSLIDALLFLAHEEEATALESSAVDELVRESVETHRELLSHKPVTLDVGVAEPLTVRAPVGMAACVVNNLLINAINNTEQGHIDVRVEEHVLSVQDTGIGIPKAICPASSSGATAAHKAGAWAWDSTWLKASAIAWAGTSALSASPMPEPVSKSTSHPLSNGKLTIF